MTGTLILWKTAPNKMGPCGFLPFSLPRRRLHGTQYLRVLVPRTIPFMDFGARNLKDGVLGRFGYGQEEAKPKKFTRKQLAKLRLKARSQVEPHPTLRGPSLPYRL